jgi:hypothetical protein
MKVAEITASWDHDEHTEEIWEIESSILLNDYKYLLFVLLVIFFIEPPVNGPFSPSKFKWLDSTFKGTVAQD